MMILHSEGLLDQLTELESKIQKVEKLMSELGVDCDKELLLKVLLAKKRAASSGQ